MEYALSYANVVALVAYILLGAFVAWSNPKSPMNWSGALLLWCLGMWAFVQFFFQHPQANLELGTRIGHVCSLGWCGYASLGLWMTLMFTRRESVLKRRWFYFANFLPPLVFVYFNWRGAFFGSFIRYPWGIEPVWRTGPVSILFFIYICTVSVLTLYAQWDFTRKTRDSARRRQVMLFFHTSVACQLLGIASEFLIPQLAATAVPRIGHLAALIWAVTVAYILSRYRGFALSTVAAAESIVETMSSFLVLLDKKQKIAAVNRAACALTGFTRGELYGRSAARLFTKSDPEMEKAFSGGGALHAYDARLRRKTGDSVPVSLSTSAVIDYDDRLVGVICVGDDTTLRTRAEDDLRRSNEEWRTFAYVASHDLQEPLRMVASYLGLIRRRYGDKLDKDGEEFIGFAVEGAQRMQRLIEDLLTYSRVGTRGKPFEPTDCSKVMARTVKNLEVAVRESGAEITWTDLPVVAADETQLMQLFQNLIGNAIKFRRPGVAPKVELRARNTADFWEFRVIDNGIGIPPEQAVGLFRIFHRLHTREEYEGTGIGLAVCRRIVERHGGKIWIDIGDHNGAVIAFTLPLTGVSLPHETQA